MLRWGILGAGRAAAHVAAPAMRAVGGDLAVVASRSRSNAQLFAASHGVRRARDAYEAVIEAEDVDAVYVALPNDLHEPWAIAALEAGKHVLCEKPLAISAAAAGRMAATAARADRVLMEALMTRFHPRTRHLLEIVSAGAIGPVRAIQAVFTARMDDPQSHRADPDRGGGALLDLGGYGVAMSRWLAQGEPDRVVALDRTASRGVDAATEALLGFPSGALATMLVAHDAARHESLTVIGSDGVLEVGHAFSASDDTEAALVRDGRVVGAWRANPYERMLHAFEKACHDGSPRYEVDDSLQTARVLDQVREAAAAR